MPLSEQNIEDLESLLFSDDLDEEALDYFGLHGLICASIVGPTPLSERTIISIVFSNDDLHLKADENKFFIECIQKISESIYDDLNQGLDIQLPYSKEVNDEEDTHYDACLESWCTGFMEGFFYQEDAWFAKGEDVAAELLLPIMALSGLFESNEFQDIRQNNKLMTQFEEIMPDQLVDIFLFYHSD